MGNGLERVVTWSAIGGECTVEEPFASEHSGMFIGFISETSYGYWPKTNDDSVPTESRWFHAYAFGATIQEIPIEPPASIDKWMMKSMRRIRGGPSIEWASCWDHMQEEQILTARARAKNLAKAIGTERRDLVVDLFEQDWAQQKLCVGHLAIHDIIDDAIEQGILRAARHQPWEDGCLLVFLQTDEDDALLSALREIDSVIVELV